MTALRNKNIVVQTYGTCSCFHRTINGAVDAVNILNKYTHDNF